jgi:hypothetical protein
MPTSWYPAVKTLLIVAIFRNKATNLTIPGFYLLTHSMEKRPSREANQFSASQGVPCTLWNQEVHYHIYK